MVLNELTLSYLAGFFDGEGSVGVYRNKTSHARESLSLLIQCGGCDFASIELYQTAFGGGVSYRKARGRQRQQWNWQASGVIAHEALKAMLPYLRLKRDRALLALSFPLGTHGKRLPQATRDERSLIQDGLRKMNKRGT